MATNYTSNYQLCQWEPEDQVNRLEFNQDNSRIEEGLLDLLGKLDEVKSTITSNVASLEQQISQVHGNITTMEQSLNTLESSIQTVESNVNTLQGSIKTVESKVSTLEGSTSTMNSSLTTLQSNVSTLQSSTSTMNSSLTTVQSNVSTLQTNYGTLNTSLSTASTKAEDAYTLASSAYSPDNSNILLGYYTGTGSGRYLSFGFPAKVVFVIEDGQNFTTTLSSISTNSVYNQDSKDYQTSQYPYCYCLSNGMYLSGNFNTLGKRYLILMFR